MTPALHPYPAYKPSGVKWLGDVPIHWTVPPVKRHFQIQLGKMLQPSANSADDVEIPYLLRSLHVQWNHVRLDDAPKMWAHPPVKAYLKYGSVTKGDLPGLT